MARSRRRGGRRLLAAAALIAAAVVALALLRVGPPPAVEIEPALPGIGPATPVVVRATAPGRGLTWLRVELIQGELAATLAERSYRPRPFWAFWGRRQASEEIALEVGWRSHPELTTGEAALRVTAGRAPTPLRRPAPAVREITLPVRREPPSLIELSSQVNPAQGGSEAVVYRVGPRVVRDGVEVGDRWFPGYPLPGGREGERFALFAAPYDLEDPGAIRLVAEDELGNRAVTAVVDRYQPRPLRRAEIRLSEGFMSRVVPEILARSSEIRDQGDLLANYLAINGELRRINRRRLAEIAASSRPGFLWRRPFRQLSNTQVTAAFADRRTYLYQGRPVDRQDHLGFDLASVERAPVESSNSGVVAFTGYLGIYGNTVVVDHGYGLQTLYAHLSEIGVEEGQTVERGQLLGRTGDTGLAAGDHLHFAVLLRGLPVNPLEWWDGRWIRDHLVAKLGPALPFNG